MATIISRAAFCKECEAAHRPHKGSLFLVYGSYRGKYYLREAMRNGTKGMTPHIFILEQTTCDGICVVSQLCGMNGCGVGYHSDKNLYGALPHKWQQVYMTISDWNALVVNKRDPQYLL